MTEPEQPAAEHSDEDGDETSDQPRNRLSKRTILTIAAVAFIVGLVTSAIITRL